MVDKRQTEWLFCRNNAHIMWPMELLVKWRVVTIVSGRSSTSFSKSCRNQAPTQRRQTQHAGRDSYITCKLQLLSVTHFGSCPQGSGSFKPGVWIQNRRIAHVRALTQTNSDVSALVVPRSQCTSGLKKNKKNYVRRFTTHVILCMSLEMPFQAENVTQTRC